jgi:hypothetical protein
MQNPKVKSALPFVGVIKRDEKNRPTLLRVPGSEGKSYEVSINREDGKGKLNVSCQCQGNHKTICYHCRTVVKYILKDTHKNRWFGNYKEAFKMLMGGKILVVQSSQSNQMAYVVINKKGV